jgi:CMP-N-acetylneuraminic acid synthetase
MIILAVIPARGGSKSIKNKNIIKVKRIPLITYTIRNAIRSKAFNYIVVTSDSANILNISKKFKNIINIIRPKKLSSDFAKTKDVILHALNYLKRNRIFADLVYTLEPTSPLRSVNTIKTATKALANNPNYDSLISVTKSFSLYGKINKNKYFKYFSKTIKRRRQDRKPIFKETGTIWGTRVKYLLKTKELTGGKIFPLIVPKIEDLDINNKEDLSLFSKIL